MWVSGTFEWGFQTTAPVKRNWVWSIRSAAHPPRNNYHQVQNQTWRQIHKTRLSTCSKFCPKSPNIKPATTNHFQNDLWFQPRLANVLPTPRQCHGCHADGKKCPMSCTCHARWRFRLKFPRCPMCAARNWHNCLGKNMNNAREDP